MLYWEYYQFHWINIYLSQREIEGTKTINL